MLSKSLVILALVCLGTSLAKTTTASDQSPSNNNFCQGCRSMVSFATKFNSTSEHEKYSQVFKTFCELYYPASTDFRQGPCPYFVDGVFYLLNRVDPVHHCDDIGACKVSQDDESEISDGFGEDFDSQLEPTRTEASVCDMCESFVKQAKAQLRDPKNIDMLKHNVAALCDYLRVVGLDQECHDMLNQYIDQFLEFVDQIDPLQYCQAIGVCNKKMIENKKFLSRNPLLTAPASLLNFHNFALDTHVAEPLQEEPSQSLERPGPACAICKTVVIEIEHLLKSNRTEESIENILIRICDMIFKNNAKQQQCDDMVKAYTKELIQILADESNPEMVCMLIEQCTYEHNQAPILPDVFVEVNREPEMSIRKGLIIPTSPVPSIGEFISMMDPDIQLNSMRTCVECKLFIGYLQETFESPKSRDTLKQWLLDNLCDHLEDEKTRDSCKKMVDTYSDDFFKAIAQQLEPQEVCADLKACHKKSLMGLIYLQNPELSTEAATVLEESSNGTDGDDPDQIEPQIEISNKNASSICDQCVDIVKQLDDYLSSHPIENNVDELIEQVCNKIPNAQAQETCTMIVKTVGQELVEKLHTMDNPTQFCHSIYLC